MNKSLDYEIRLHSFNAIEQKFCMFKMVSCFEPKFELFWRVFFPLKRKLLHSTSSRLQDLYLNSIFVLFLLFLCSIFSIFVLSLFYLYSIFVLSLFYLCIRNFYLFFIFFSSLCYLYLISIFEFKLLSCMKVPATIGS